MKKFNGPQAWIGRPRLNVCPAPLIALLNKIISYQLVNCALGPIP